MKIRYMTLIILHSKCAVTGDGAKGGGGGSKASVLPNATTNFVKIRPVRAELFIRTDGRTDATQQVRSKRHALNNSGWFSLGNQ